MPDRRRLFGSYVFYFDGTIVVDAPLSARADILEALGCGSSRVARRSNVWTQPATGRRLRVGAGSNIRLCGMWGSPRWRPDWIGAELTERIAKAGEWMLELKSVVGAYSHLSLRESARHNQLSHTAISWLGVISYNPSRRWCELSQMVSFGDQ
jgi:hypothetical protein